MFALEKSTLQECFFFCLKKNNKKIKKVGTQVLTLPKNVIYYNCSWQRDNKSANNEEEKKMTSLEKVFNELDNMFYGNGGYRSFPLDLSEIENGYLVVAEMPGVTKENVKIEFEDGILTISAKKSKDEHATYLINERDTLPLKRSISFGDIDEDTITAKMENGLLMVTIKTKVAEEKPKRTIEIE